MSKKSITAALEATLLHGGQFSADLLNTVLMNFIDELEESLHDDADDALICVLEDDHDVAMVLIEWNGAVLQNEQAFERLKQMWKHNFPTNIQTLIPLLVGHIRHGMLGVAGVKWIETPV